MVTLVTEGRARVFGHIEGTAKGRPGTAAAPHMVLSELGRRVLEEEVPKISRFYPQVEVWRVAMMPDHVHLLMRVKEALPEGKHLGQVIRGFKTGCTRTWWALENERRLAGGEAGMMQPSGKALGTVAAVVEGEKMQGAGMMQPSGNALGTVAAVVEGDGKESSQRAVVSEAFPSGCQQMDTDSQQREQTDSQQQEQADSQQQGQADNQQREQADSQQQEQADSQQREQADSQQQGETDSQQREQTDSQQQEQADSQQQGQADSQQREQADSQQQGQADNQQREQADSQQREQADSQQQGQADNQQREQTGNQQQGQTRNQQQGQTGNQREDTGLTHRPLLFASGYHDRIINRPGMLENIKRYMQENPLRARIREECPRLMQRQLHLWIDGREYAAFGNLFLLKYPQKEQVFFHRYTEVDKAERQAILSSFQQSTINQPHLPLPGREGGAVSQITGREGGEFSNGEKLLLTDKERQHLEKAPMKMPTHLTVAYQEEYARLLRIAGEGTVLVTPGISKGERLVVSAAIEQQLPLILLQKEPITRYWKPEQHRFYACSRGWLLILAPWQLDEEIKEKGEVNGYAISTTGQPVSDYARFHHLNDLARDICGAMKMRILDYSALQG